MALVAGCGSSSLSQPVGTYAGTVAGSDALVAVVAGKANVVVYVCDGKQGVAELFTGQRHAGGLALRDSHGARVSVKIDQHSAAGTFTPVGGARVLRFVAPVARGRAGLYRALRRVRGVRTSLGWVVLNDGRQRGALTSAGRIGPAPTLSTNSGTATLNGSVTISVAQISPTSISRTGLGGDFSGFGG